VMPQPGRIALTQPEAIPGVTPCRVRGAAGLSATPSRHCRDVFAATQNPVGA
jgi:hypothetical protein